MIKVSSEFYNTMKTRTDFKQFAEITFRDNTVITLNENNFTLKNNHIVDASQCSNLPLGVAIARNIQLELMNDNDEYSTFDFFGAKIRLYLTFQLSSTLEKIEFGTFTVISPTTRGTTIIINAVDDMYKLDRPYETNLVYPQSLLTIYTDICTKCNILPEPSSLNFLNNKIQATIKPNSDVTFRQVLGYVAMIACGNARINRFGKMEILTYDFKFLSSSVDGGHFKPWDQLATTDGGTFLPWNTGIVIDAGTFDESQLTYHNLSEFKNLTVDTDDVVITGVQSKFIDDTDTEKTLLIGEEGYVINIENPLFDTTQKEIQLILNLLANILIGGRMRKFTGDHIAYPLIEFMDNVIIQDRKGNVYSTVITDVNFNFFGLTTLKNSADNELHNNSTYADNSSKIITSTKKLVEKEKTQRELAIDNLANQLSKSSGLYMTQNKQSDGSIIYLMHDKPTLNESMIVWKLTAQAIAISTDGGKTYPYGLSATGETILGLIYAIGLNADYITTGRIADEKNKNYWDLNTGDMNITEGVINIRGNKTFYAKDYTQQDISKVEDSILGKITLTDTEIEKYDIDCNTIIDAKDLLRIRKMVDGKVSQYNTPLNIQIDASGKQTGYLIRTPNVTIGTSGIKAEYVSCNYVNITDSNLISAKTFNVHLDSNPYVSPYKAYGFHSFTDMTNIENGKQEIISATACDISMAPIPCYLSEDRKSVFVVGPRSETVKVTVVLLNKIK